MDQKMILKLVIIGAVLLSIYKYMGGSFALPKSKDRDEKPESDALEECVTCGTFVTKKESIVLKGKLYCSKECLPD
jgi:uncharacterized protein